MNMKEDLKKGILELTTEARLRKELVEEKALADELANALITTREGGHSIYCPVWREQMEPCSTECKLGTAALAKHRARRKV